MNYNVKHGSLTAFFASVPGCKTSDRDFREENCIQFLKDEVFIPKDGLAKYHTVNFNIQDVARQTGLPVTVRFEYTKEPYDDVSDKLRLVATRVVEQPIEDTF